MSSFCENFNIGFTQRLFSRINSNLSFMNFTFPPMPTPNFSFMNFTFPSILGCTNSFESFNSHNYFNNSFPSIWNNNTFQQNNYFPQNFNYSMTNFTNSFDWGDTFVKKETQEKYSDKDTSSYANDATELKSRWSKVNSTLSQEFYNKVIQISNRLNCNADDLMALMNAESGLKPTARNKSSDATGLIQFMPNTAKDLGTSIEALKNMSAEEQLVYVEKYLVKAKSNAGLSKDSKIDAGTLYALVWLPGRAKKKILAESGDKYYQANKGLDKNNDGSITKEDLKKQLDSKRA